MMSNLDQIYDASFFREWGRAHHNYIRSAELIVAAIQDMFKPASVADLGCGCGVYAHAFMRKGVSVVAIDGVQSPADYSFPVPVHLQDLTRPFPNRWGRVDIALCLEVAEHIPESQVAVFLENITGFSDRLILSAAPPGQGGHHHVNEQPKRYWVRKLARLGFIYNRRQTGRLFQTLNAIPLPYMWMAQQISIYEKATAGAKDKPDIAFGVRRP